MNFTSDEVADASRDVAALLRASVGGKKGDIDAVLDGAGDRGTRCIAETLLAAAADLAVRLTVAVSAIEGDEMRHFVISLDSETILEEPEIREAVEKNLAGVQGRIIRGE